MRTLLLADDSITVQRVIALTFAEEPIRVVTVADGQQAMERMAAQKPDIVLAGTTLPQVSGYDLARFMRSKPDLKSVPVLLLSGAFETVDEARLVSSGANGVLEKPVEPTIVIGRVKELLGLKAETTPSAAGRLVTPAQAPAEPKLPAAQPPRAVTSTKGAPGRWEQLRNQTGLDANTKSVEDSSTRSDDYLDTLDAALDTLDQQLSGRLPAAKPQRNPSGPLGQSSGTADPRSPGKRPTNSDAVAGNPIFEVDQEWFSGGDGAARTGGAAAGGELPSSDLTLPKSPAADPIYEVDDAWFAEDDKARAERLVEQQQLAAEMGINEVDLAAVAGPGEGAASATEDFDFGLDDIKPLAPEATQASAPAHAPAPPASAKPTPAPAKAAPAPVPAKPASPPGAIAPMPSVPKPSPAPAPPTAPAAATPPRVTRPPAAVRTPSVVADDFAALLAYEQGERQEPPAPPVTETKVVAPEVTSEMLDQIAVKVAERLSSGMFGAQLKDAITSTMRHAVTESVNAAVRPIVSETAERVVREVVSKTAERAVREVVTQSVERAIPAAVASAVERSVQAAVGPAVDRAVRDAATEAAGRVTHDIVSEISERLVREEIERIKSRRTQ